MARRQRVAKGRTKAPIDGLVQKLREGGRHATRSCAIHSWANSSPVVTAFARVKVEFNPDREQQAFISTSDRRDFSTEILHVLNMFGSSVPPRDDGPEASVVYNLNSRRAWTTETTHTTR